MNRFELASSASLVEATLCLLCLLFRNGEFLWFWSWMRWERLFFWFLFFFLLDFINKHFILLQLDLQKIILLLLQNNFLQQQMSIIFLRLIICFQLRILFRQQSVLIIDFLGDNFNIIKFFTKSLLFFEIFLIPKKVKIRLKGKGTFGFFWYVPARILLLCRLFTCWSAGLLFSPGLEGLLRFLFGYCQ